MITGPVDTPYEHGLFVFDVHLPPDYPASPPVFFYLSQCSGRLNPNLYDDGKVCVSLLGTWSGRGSEVWTSKSNVLQVLVSIQGIFYNFSLCLDHLLKLIIALITSSEAFHLSGSFTSFFFFFPFLLYFARTFDLRLPPLLFLI